MKKTFILAPCDTLKACFGNDVQPKNLAVSLHTLQPCKVTIEVDFFAYDYDADVNDDLPF